MHVLVNTHLYAAIQLSKKGVLVVRKGGVRMNIGQLKKILEQYPDEMMVRISFSIHWDEGFRSMWQDIKTVDPVVNQDTNRVECAILSSDEYVRIKGSGFQYIKPKNKQENE